MRPQISGFVNAQMHGNIQAAPKVCSNRISTWWPAATWDVIDTKLKDDIAYKGYHTDPAWTHMQPDPGP